MNSYTKYLCEKSIFSFISILSIIALTPFIYGVLPAIDSVLLGLFDTTRNLVVNTISFPNLSSAIFISLFFISPLWIFAIWKIIVPNCKIGLLPACLGLLFVIFSTLFVCFVYIPSFLSFIIPIGNGTTSLSLHMFRDFTVKSLVYFILLFQIFPITLHFRKNYSRSFLFSILIRVILLLVILLFATLIAPPDILSQLLIILPVIILFELARGIRRYVIIENGRFFKISNQLR